MAKEKAKNIAKDIREVEGNIQSYKRELLEKGPEEQTRKIHKLVTRANEKKRHSTFKLRKAESKEKAVEKQKKGQDNFMYPG